MKKRNNIGIFNSNSRHREHQRDIDSQYSEPLTTDEEKKVLLELAAKCLHSELSWVTYYLKKNMEKNARASLVQAWDWYKRYSDLGGEPVIIADDKKALLELSAKYLPSELHRYSDLGGAQ